MTEEIRHITWDLWGQELSHEQTIQRLARAGFPLWRLSPTTGREESPILTMFAIVEGESGEYMQAWHINVERNEDGTITRFDANGNPWTSGDQFMMIKSVDLGFMQFNVEVPDQLISMDDVSVTAWVENMFFLHPNLAIPQDSADAAYQRWLRDGYKPWFAYANRTPAAWHTKLKEALVGFDAWLIHSFIGVDLDTGKRPVRVWKT